MHARPKTAADRHGIFDSLHLFAETTSWVAAWLILPLWLGFRGAAFTDFLIFASGAGALLSFAVAADRPDALDDLHNLAWLSFASWLPVLIIGGAVFGLASIFA